jgi:hypothetical protein
VNQVKGMSTDNSLDGLNRALRTLIRGLTQNNLNETYDAYKALSKAGTNAIPLIEDAIHQSSWRKIRRANEVRYVVGLMSVLHDIDEAESRRIASELKRNGCDPSLGVQLDSICRFTTDDYRQYALSDIRVFEHNRLSPKQMIQKRLEGWLKNVPKTHLTEIGRIYILRREDMTVLGWYVPVLCNISLAWDNPYSIHNPLSYLSLYIIETVLYHEIGHHVFRHTFGQEEKQEKEANEYADYLMLRSNRLLFRILREIFPPSRVSPLDRKLRNAPTPSAVDRL